MNEQKNRNLLKQAIFDGISQRYEEELSATQEFLIYSKARERKRRRKRILLFVTVALLTLAALVLSWYLLLAYFSLIHSVLAMRGFSTMERCLTGASTP